MPPVATNTAAKSSPQEKIEKSNGTKEMNTSNQPEQTQEEQDRGGVILTTYPNQSNIHPVPLQWGLLDPEKRGPIVASRAPNCIRRRNAIGAHGGSYSVYHALSVASGAIPINHHPDYTNCQPTWTVKAKEQWDSRIVSLDPFGYKLDWPDMSELQIRPTIAITRAHMRVPELGKGVFKVDGSVVLNEDGELQVSKGAVEPVWWLPGVASRFGVGESTLRRALFEDTGGMYPELITRPDLKVFLPPIGGLSIYIFGNPDDLSNPAKKLTVRVHDECNGSDVFGSDICTCRPYLIHGIKLCVEEAQQGGVGLIVYFRKEGRALGEVTKYLVYNARKRQEGGDQPSTYFTRTESVAGVKDARFQALMPDILHWLGIKKIDRMVSMSNMKYDAIVNAGIPILERVEIPADLLPADSRVEIEAKIADGYYSTALDKFENGGDGNASGVKGRVWDDVVH